MNIKKSSYGTTHILAPVGKIDSNTAPELQAAVSQVPDSAKEIIFDFSAVDYISSAGLRVLVMSQSMMEDHGGSVTITNVNKIVDDIFAITGFGELLTIER